MNYSEIVKQKINQLVSESEGKSASEVFLKLAYEVLGDSIEVVDLVITNYKNEFHNLRLDGYDLIKEDEVSFYISEYDLTDYMLDNNDIEKIYGSVVNFYEKSINGLYKQLNEDDSIYDVCEMLYATSTKIKKINVYIITNKMFNESQFNIREKYGVQFCLKIVDINALKELNLLNEIDDQDIKIIFKNGVQFLKQEVSNDKFDIYLMFVNGEELAKLYDQYGYSLLEGNVRAYLKKTNKQNAGILDTVKYYPDCFVTYNNGLSTVANNIEIKDGKIKTIDGWKIVNGGQTTATLHQAFLEKLSTLENVSVPVKLTVIKKESGKVEFISKISEYANTQNKVSQSDLTSNQGYHKKIEKLSRTICIPTGIPGTELQKWFYERLRRQYDLSLDRAPSSLAFKAEFPKIKKFDKTDLANAIMAWEQEPFTVGLGKENNFLVFNNRVRANEEQFIVDEDYYKKCIALVIMYRCIGEIVKKIKFGGFAANVVAYTVSLISYLSSKKLDLTSIWEDQCLSDELVNIAHILAKEVYNVITDTPDTKTNVQMYCRCEECWDKVFKYDYGLIIPDDLCVEQEQCILPNNNKTVIHGQEIEMDMITHEQWGELAAWGRNTELISPLDRKMAYSMMKLKKAGKSPTPKQKDYAKSIIRNAMLNGFKIK